jgi:hypothetical protein
MKDVQPHYNLNITTLLASTSIFDHIKCYFTITISSSKHKIVPEWKILKTMQLMSLAAFIATHILDTYVSW